MEEIPFMDLEEAKKELAFMKNKRAILRAQGIKIRRKDYPYRRALLEIIRLNRIIFQLEKERLI